MGDATRLRNPHLRAGLAEALEAIVPNKHHSGGRTLNRFVRSKFSLVNHSSSFFVSVLLPKLFLRIIH